MKYMVLVYGGQEAWDPVGEDAGGGTRWTDWHVKELHAYMDAINQELIRNGELVVGAGLEDPTHTTTVRSNDGVPLVTDGPYLEAKEFLAGWWVIDVAGYERAAELAARVSDAPTPDGPKRARVEIRPVAGVFTS